MITISYQTFSKNGFQLRLRLYQAPEVKYITVTKLLKGSLYSKHWNQKKQLFIPSAPFSEENNGILVQFRKKYEEAAINWTGSLYGMLAAMETAKESSNVMTVSQFIQTIIDGLAKNKHPDGTLKGSYEGYEKCNRRLMEFCKLKHIRYDKLLITELTPSFVDGVFDWVDSAKGGRGKSYVSAMLHAIIARADKEGYLDASGFRRCKWHKKVKTTAEKFHTLTEEQCKKLAEMDLSEVSQSPLNELYRDFCLFILYTGQSPCDAISLKYSDIRQIGGISHFVFRRRKIAERQALPCTVPIGEEVQQIMNRWRKRSKDGYIFPIRTKAKLREQETNNGDIKHFIKKLNIWLKKIGDALCCRFPLHTYTFRHTAITHYISKGIPVVYVANMMGTSVQNCEKIYYNNHGDTASRNKVMSVMKF